MKIYKQLNARCLRGHSLVYVVCKQLMNRERLSYKRPYKGKLQFNIHMQDTVCNIFYAQRKAMSKAFD